MDAKLLYQPLDQIEADAVAVVLFEDEPPQSLNFATAWLGELRASGEVTGKVGGGAVLDPPNGLRAKRFVVTGGAKRAEFDAAALRKTVGGTVRALKQKGVRRLAWWLDSGDAGAAIERALFRNVESD